MRGNDQVTKTSDLGSGLFDVVLQLFGHLALVLCRRQRLTQFLLQLAVVIAQLHDGFLTLGNLQVKTRF